MNYVKETLEKPRIRIDAGAKSRDYPEGVVRVQLLDGKRYISQKDFNLKVHDIDKAVYLAHELADEIAEDLGIKCFKTPAEFLKAKVEGLTRKGIHVGEDAVNLELERLKKSSKSASSASSGVVMSQITNGMHRERLARQLHESCGYDRAKELLLATLELVEGIEAEIADKRAQTATAVNTMANSMFELYKQTGTDQSGLISDCTVREAYIKLIADSGGGDAS